MDLLDRVPGGFGLVLCVLLPGLVYFLRRLLLPKPLPGIPYNVEAANSLLGDIPALRAAPNRREWWARQTIRHQSPLVQVFMRPFSQPWVFIADHYEAFDVCMRRQKEFDRSEATISMFKGVTPSHHITMLSTDPQFKKNREMVRDLMSNSFLHEVSAPTIHEKFMNLIKLWDGKLAMCNGRPFEAAEDIHNSALDIIMALSFGPDAIHEQTVKHLSLLESNATKGSDDDEFKFADLPLDEELHFFTILSESVAVAIRSPFPRIHHFLYRHLSAPMRRAQAGRDRLRNREVTKSVERRKSGHSERCALDNMLAREDAMAEKEGRQPNYYSDTIMDELLGYLVAGHETTSSALRWGMKYLTDDQRVQSRLRSAIYDAHPQAREEKRVPTVSEITKSHVPYLDAVIEEVVRHSKPAPITLRQAQVDTQLLGHFIPKGTTVGFLGNGPGVMWPSLKIDDTKRSEASQAHMKRVPLFDDATVVDFLPERWLKTRADGGGEEVFDQNNGPTQAFGIGPRGCYGKKLAYIEMQIYFTLILWEFKFGPLRDDLATHDEAVALTRTPKHVFLKLEKTVY